MLNLHPASLICFLICIIFLTAGCNPGAGLQDESIDPDLRTELARLNKQIIAGLAHNEPQKVLAICSDVIVKDKEQRKALYELAANTKGNIDPERFVIKKQFYERRRSKNEAISVSAGTGNEHDYIINYHSPTRKSYVLVGYFEDSIKTFAVLSIYGNYNGVWKLNTLRVGAVKVFGKDAVDWYYRARQQYGDNAIVDAASSESMCKSLLQPAGEGWHYRNEADMSALSEQIKNTADMRFSFPIMVDSVATKPRIISVSPILFSDGYFPGVAYATNLRLSDTAALSRECDSLNAHIGSIFEGLDHYNKTIIYRAFIRVPADGRDTAIPHYDIVKQSAATWFY